MTANGGGGALATLRAALSLFTVIPVGGPRDISRETASRAVLWLPVLGGLLGSVAALALLGVELAGPSGPRRLLAATVAVAVLAALTGALHLDGLADTADGLGSRRPRSEALAIMRRPDVGPMGVAALVLVVLTQVTALAAVPPGRLSAAALVTAVITGRVAVVLATGLPAARPEGFGALVAASTRWPTAHVVGAGLLAIVALAGAALGGPSLALRGLGAVVAGYLAASLLALAALRRLGGMTGDVFGAVTEVSTAVVLLVLAVGG
jgi:adenosylcobinamide-GDP ribazoletransferase